MGKSSKERKVSAPTVEPLSLTQQVKRVSTDYCEQHTWIYTFFRCASIVAFLILLASLAFLLTPVAPFVALRGRSSETSMSKIQDFPAVQGSLTSSQISSAIAYDTLRASPSASSASASTSDDASLSTRLMHFFSLPSFPGAAAAETRSKLREQDELCLKDQNIEKHPLPCVTVTETYAKAILNMLEQGLPNTSPSVIYFRRPNVPESDMWWLLGQLGKDMDPIKLQLYHKICVSRSARAYLMMDESTPDLKIKRTAYAVAHALAIYAYRPESPLPIYIFATVAQDYPAAANIYRSLIVANSEDKTKGIIKALYFLQNTDAIISQLKGGVSKRTPADLQLLNEALGLIKKGHIKADPNDPWEQNAFEIFHLSHVLLASEEKDSAKLSPVTAIFAAMAYGTVPAKKGQIVATPSDEAAWEVEQQAQAFERTIVRTGAAVVREQQALRM